MSRDRVLIGRIVGCHGLRGDLKIRAASDTPDWVDAGLPHVYLQGPEDDNPERLDAYPVDTVRSQGGLILLRLKGYADRTAAETLLGRSVYADLKNLPPPSDNEFWADDLRGLTVLDHDSRRRRGVVKDILSSGGSDFLEILIDDSAETVVIPFIEQFFPEVDLEARTITVDLLGDFLSEPVTDDRLTE